MVHDLVSPTPTLHRFSVEEYFALHDAGILDIALRTELIDGQIVQMSPASPPQACAVDIIDDHISAKLGQTAWVRVEKPIVITHQESVPNPDLAICKFREDRYAFAHPGASEILLLIEVSLTSLVFDRGKKRKLYQTAGIQEYWIVDLNNRQLERYVTEANGIYLTPKIYAEGARFEHERLGTIVLEALLPMAAPAG